MGLFLCLFIISYYIHTHIYAYIYEYIYGCVLKRVVCCVSALLTFMPTTLGQNDETEEKKLNQNKIEFQNMREDPKTSTCM